jgi:PAS domain S-box-containing protein
MENASEKKQVPFVLLNPTERLINIKKAELKARFGKENIDGLIHELQVSRVELELHNAELERSRKKLEKVKNKYHSLFEYSPVGYIIFDHEGFISDVNESCCIILGMKKDFLIRRMLHFFIVPEDREAFSNFFINTLCEQEKQTCILKVRNKNGEIFYAQLEGLKFEDENSELPQIRVAMLDITERKRAEDAIKKSGEELLFYKKFLEEKTLDLASVFISLAKSERYLRDTQKTTEQLIESFSKEIKTISESLACSEDVTEKEEIVKELLNKANNFIIKGAQVKESQPAVSRIKLYPLIREVLLLLKPEFNNLKIIPEPNKEVLVLGQKEMLRFILKNIFTNVIGATPQSGELSLKVSEYNSAVEICFTKFSNKTYGNKKSNKLKTGTAFKTIPLKICKDLIESVGGSMSFNEGSKTTDFKFLLPKKFPPLPPNNDSNGSKLKLSAA